MRSVVVTHDATRDTMLQDLSTGPFRMAMQKVSNGTVIFSVIVSDALLVGGKTLRWRELNLTSVDFRLGDAMFFGCKIDGSS